jgi:hypothetical protein
LEEPSENIANATWNTQQQGAIGCPFHEFKFKWGKLQSDAQQKAQKLLGFK